MSGSGSRTSPLRTVVIAILAVAVIFLALPQQWKTWAPGFLRNPALHLGLDLAGGTQLDFRISEEEIHQQLADLDAQIARASGSGVVADLQAQKTSVQEQQRNLVEAIRTVLERRINGLGVSEATITPSYIGDEKHLLVECPGVIDVQECIKVVGKTIQLEFKEEFTEATEDFTKGVRANVALSVRKMTESGVTLEKLGQDIGSQLGMAYSNSQSYFKDQLPKGLEDAWTLKPGAKPIQREGTIDVPVDDGNGGQVLRPVSGIFLAEALRPLTATGRVLNEAPKAFAQLAKTETGVTYAYREKMQLDAKFDPVVGAALRGMQSGELKAVAAGSGARVIFLRQFRPGHEQVEASHILVSYKGAAAAEAGVTRTKEEALARAKELKAQLDKGANFDALARAQSDGPSKTNGGKLGAVARGDVAPSFEEKAFTMQAGQISEPVESPYGYHIIRVDKAKTTTVDEADYDALTIADGPLALTKGQSLVTMLQNGDVKAVEQAATLRTLFFSLTPSGWKDTQLDGKHFRHAAVTVDPITNVPVVQIAFDTEGGRLFQELTRKNIGKPIAIFVGGELISAPRVQGEISGGTAVITGSSDFKEAQQLAQDLNTGAIPAPIHLAGQHTVEGKLGAAALQTSLIAGLIGVIILMLYMVLVYRLLGLVANAALVIFSLITFAILKLPLFLVTDTYVVLTLAGMAGIILSIGMAVDANVLVFERMKEELRKGKSVKTALESGFKHSWPAIRDGNVSTIITCVILFAVGTSIVRGFAVTLGLGVLLSMLTAVLITRWMLRRLVAMPGFDKPSLYVRIKS